MNEPKQATSNDSKDMIKRDMSTQHIYGNYLDLRWTPYDLTVRIAQVVPSEDPSREWIAAERAAVTIPWEQAKGLRDLLTQALERYEKLNGDLTIPKLP